MQGVLEGTAGRRLFRDRERLNELCDRPSSFKAWLLRICGSEPQPAEQQEVAALQQAAEQQVRAAAPGKRLVLYGFVNAWSFLEPADY